MHLKDNTLHAYLDGELPAPDRARAEQHLETCDACRQRLDAFAHRAHLVSAHLAALEPRASEAPQPAAYAIRQLRNKEKTSMFKHIFRRPAFAALTILLVLAVLLSFQPVRALASSFLDLFRIQQITLLPMDMTSFRGGGGEPSMAETMGQLFSDSVDVTRESSESVEVSSAGEASQLAGFAVRTWPGEQAKELSVQPGMAFQFPIQEEQVRALLDEAGKTDIQIPPELDDVTVSVDIPDGVSATYGECRMARSADPHDPDDQALLRGENCIRILQVPSPTVTTDPDVDPAQIAVIGLRFLGMSEEDALSFSESVDWTSTLVIPVPRGQVSYEPVEVDGVSGNVLIETENDDPNTRYYSILWVKDGVIYNVMGSGNPAKGLEVANGLQ